MLSFRLRTLDAFDQAKESGYFLDTSCFGILMYTDSLPRDIFTFIVIILLKIVYLLYIHTQHTHELIQRKQCFRAAK